MNSQIDEFERIMLDYLKGEISSEDMQKLTILLKRENTCREKYREISPFLCIGILFLVCTQERAKL